MDSARFDRLSRMFASRRATLAGLGGVITGFLSRAADPEGAEARPTVCRPGGSRCFPSRGLDCCQGSTCLSGRCRVQNQKCKPTKQRCCRNRDCPNNLICAKRRCGCGPERTRCQNRCCGPNQLCRNGACVAPTCGYGAPCRVFVSDAVGSAALGGLDGADKVCQDQANAVPALAGGTYRAWLSTTNESPTTRFSHLPGSGPFVMLNGAAIANSWADLISGSNLLTNFNVMSDGDTVVAEPATNTDSFGTPLSDLDCGAWISDAPDTYGNVGSTTSQPGWTENFVRDCSLSQRLFCFEQR